MADFASAVVGPFKYTTPDNPQSKRSFIDTLDKYSSTSSGQFRLLQLIAKASDLAAKTFAEMDKEAPIFFKNYARAITGAWTSLSIVSMIHALNEAFAKIRHIVRLDASTLLLPGQSRRLTLDAAQATVGAAEQVGFAGSLIANSAGNPLGELFRKLAEGFGGISAMLKLSMFVPDWLRAKQEAKTAGLDGKVVQVLNETSRYKLLEIAAAVCSVASFVFTMAVLATGGPIVSAIAGLTISLAGTIFAIWGSFYKDSMEYKPINFFDDKMVAKA